MLLYIHIPLCHRICPYCSFYKHTPGNTDISAFIAALELEMSQRLEVLRATTELSTTPTSIYLGGGTPSMLSPNHLQSLFESLHRNFAIDDKTEITMEANPETFGLSKAKVFREIGISRISLGIQSFEPHVLETLGREHTPEQASRSVGVLREAEISSINIDLMFSIPNQTRADWEKTLNHTISLRPNHISAYNLTYEEDTAFFAALSNGTFEENEDNDADDYHLAENLLTAAGFTHYETSNYALRNHQSAHNKGYWAGEDYLGLGPSAVSTFGRHRSKNVSDTSAYVKQMNSIGHATAETEILTTAQLRIERIALGLRTDAGVPLHTIGKNTKSETTHLVAEGLIQITNSHLRLTKRGRALVDPIASELI